MMEHVIQGAGNFHWNVISKLEPSNAPSSYGSISYGSTARLRARADMADAADQSDAMVSFRRLVPAGKVSHSFEYAYHGERIAYNNVR